MECEIAAHGAPYCTRSSSKKKKKSSSNVTRGLGRGRGGSDREEEGKRPSRGGSGVAGHRGPKHLRCALRGASGPESEWAVGVRPRVCRTFSFFLLVKVVLTSKTENNPETELGYEAAALFYPGLLSLSLPLSLRTSFSPLNLNSAPPPRTLMHLIWSALWGAFPGEIHLISEFLIPFLRAEPLLPLLLLGGGRRKAGPGHWKEGRGWGAPQHPPPRPSRLSEPLEPGAWAQVGVLWAKEGRPRLCLPWPGRKRWAGEQEKGKQAKEWQKERHKLGHGRVYTGTSAQAALRPGGVSHAWHGCLCLGTLERGAHHRPPVDT